MVIVGDGGVFRLIFYISFLLALFFPLSFFPLSLLVEGSHSRGSSNLSTRWITALCASNSESMYGRFMNKEAKRLVRPSFTEGL